MSTGEQPPDDYEPFERPAVEPPDAVTVIDVNRRRLAEQLESEWGGITKDELAELAEVGLFDTDLRKIDLNGLSPAFRKALLWAVVTTYLREHPEGRTVKEIGAALGLTPEQTKAALHATDENLPPVPVAVWRCTCEACGCDFVCDNSKCTRRHQVYGWLYPAKGSGLYNEYLSRIQAGACGDVANQWSLMRRVQDAEWDTFGPKTTDLARDLYRAMHEVKVKYDVEDG